MKKSLISLLLSLLLSLFFISCNSSLSEKEMNRKFDDFIGSNISIIVFLLGTNYSTAEIEGSSGSITERIYNFNLYGSTTNTFLCIESVDFGKFCINTMKYRNLIFRTAPSGIILSWCTRN
jgi:hypothetical protein